MQDLIKLSAKHHAYSHASKVKNITGEGNSETGWIHSGLVRTVQDLGFKSWRRMWFLRSFDKAYFKKEGLKKESVESYYQQVRAEAFKTFAESIDEGHPLLVSLVKKLGVKKSPHLVVMTGYKKNLNGDIEGFYVNDPNNPKNGSKVRPMHKDQFISASEFDKIWRKRAIFIQPKAE